MKIAIDPGHGMSNRQRGIYDPGAVHFENGIQFKEAEIALKYGLSLKDILRSRYVNVFMTRDDEQDHAPVGERASNAKNAGCDLFISVHLNDFDDDSANGIEVLYGNEGSRQLAQNLQTALLAATNFKDRKIKKRTDLAVMKFDGNAALIELGFIANDSNRETLLNPQKREEICNAIVNTILS